MARMSRILGPDGERVDLDALFGEPQAGPSTFTMRHPFSISPADGLTPARLAQIHRAAANGDPTTWLQLAEDLEERDPHYLAVLGTRRRSVGQLPVTVEAASDASDHVKHADMLREWLKEGVLDACLFDMLDAIGKGFSVLEIDWDSAVDRVAPREITWRPQRWFTFDRADGETVLLREGATGQPLSPHKFVVHRHKAKSGLTIRSGLARVASWSWMFKAFTNRDWALFIQNYGQPLRLGRYDTRATEEDLAILWQAVSSIAGDCAAIVPKTMEIEFIEKKTAEKTGELYMARCDWLDQQVSKLVLGQTTTTDAVSGGHAVAQEHRLVQEDIERADARLISTTITRQVARQIVAFNFGPQDAYPTVRIGRPDELPMADFVTGFDVFARHGGTAKASEFRNRLGLSEPKGDDEVIGGRPAPAIPPGDDPGMTAGGARPKPQPARKPDRKAGFAQLRHLVSVHASAPEPEVVDALGERLAQDAAGALAGLTGEIRAAFDEATDLHDLADRLSRMSLDPKALADALGRGLALAHMSGRAALLDEIGDARDAEHDARRR